MDTSLQYLQVYPIHHMVVSRLQHRTGNVFFRYNSFSLFVFSSASCIRYIILLYQDYSLTRKMYFQNPLLLEPFTTSYFWKVGLIGDYFSSFWSQITIFAEVEWEEEDGAEEGLIGSVVTYYIISTPKLTSKVQK